MRNAAEKFGPVRVGQAERLLLGERELAGRRVVADVAAGGLAAQPLGEVARVAPGALGELLGRRRALGERAGRGRAGCRSPPSRRRRSRRGRPTNRPRNSITLSWSIVLISFRRAGHSVGRRGRSSRLCTRAVVALTPHRPGRACCRRRWGRSGRSRTAPPVRVEVLGPLRLVVDGAPVDVPGPKRRAVLALLALAEGRTVPVDHLVDALWPSEAPESGRQALHTHVSRLRGHLGPAAARLQTAPRRLPARARRRRAGRRAGADAAATARSGARGTRPARSPCCGEAHALWRGPVLADLTDVAPIAAAVEGCAQLHREVTDALVARRDRRGPGRTRSSASPPPRSPPTRCASPRSCC